MTRVRFLAFRRPVLKAVVAAALLAPAVGHDPLEDADRPFVLVLETLVAPGCSAVAYGRLRSWSGTAGADQTGRRRRSWRSGA